MSELSKCRVLRNVIFPRLERNKTTWVEDDEPVYIADFGQDKFNKGDILEVTKAEWDAGYSKHPRYFELVEDKDNED